MKLDWETKFRWIYSFGRLILMNLFQGCAMALGFVAAAHLDNVLVKLESVGKNETGKRSSGLFSFIKVRKSLQMILMELLSDQCFIGKHLDQLFLGRWNYLKLNKFHVINGLLYHFACLYTCMYSVFCERLDPLKIVILLLNRKNLLVGRMENGIIERSVILQDSVGRSDIDDKTKATLILSYGYVCLFAPHSIIASRIETTIFRAIAPHFPVVKVSSYYVIIVRIHYGTCRTGFVLIFDTMAWLYFDWIWVFCMVVLFLSPRFFYFSFASNSFVSNIFQYLLWFMWLLLVRIKKHLFRNYFFRKGVIAVMKPFSLISWVYSISEFDMILKYPKIRVC